MLRNTNNSYCLFDISLKLQKRHMLVKSPISPVQGDDLPKICIFKDPKQFVIINFLAHSFGPSAMENGPYLAQCFAVFSDFQLRHKQAPETKRKGMFSQVNP